jgi:hypothetical protein
MPADKKNLPPYLSFSTFRSFIESLHKTVIPDHIHKSLMPKLSGGVQSHLMVALRFLGLITEPDNAVTPTLRDLVDAFGVDSKWPAALGKVVTAAYKPIIGTLDISKAAVGTLEDAFRKATQLDGLMLERVVRFYIKAVKESNIPLSPHIRNRKPRVSVRRAGSRPARTSADPGNKLPKPGELPPPPVDNNAISFPIYLSGGRTGVITVPRDLTKADMTMVNSIVSAVKAYAAQTPGGGEATKRG